MNEYEVERMPLVTDSKKSFSFSLFGCWGGCWQNFAFVAGECRMEWNGELGMIIRWNSVRLGFYINE